MRLPVEDLGTLDAAITAGEYPDYVYMYPPRQAYRRLGDLSRASSMARSSLHERPDINLYIHIPFCAQICRFCNLYATSVRDASVHKQYADRVSAEARAYAGSGLLPAAVRWRTLYFGGGTPSALPIELLGDLLSDVRGSLAIDDVEELAIEVSPETVTPQYLGELREIGFDRISMGFQTTSPAEMRAIGRSYSLAKQRDIAGLTMDLGFRNLCLDLIFGLPGQDKQSWAESLQAVIAMRPHTICCYQWTSRPNTGFGRMGLHAPSGPEMRQLYYLACSELKEAGYEQETHVRWVSDEPGAENEHRQLIFRRLLEDLDRRSEMGAPDPAIVVATGDIAMSGGALGRDEYQQAALFLRSLTGRLGAGTRLMIVPGNHDVVRAGRRDAPTLRMLNAARDGTEPLDDLLAREQDSRLLAGRLDGYAEFLGTLADVDPDVASGSVLTGWSRLIEGRNFPVRFVGLNTALLANDDSDEGKLQLGYAQLRTASQDAAPDTGMVLLTHHPLEWLRDGDEAAAILNEYFDLHLYGHLHLPQSRRTALFRQQSLISIGAGATYHGRTGVGLGAGEYAYSICALGWDASGHLKVRMWPRIWSARGGRWQTDQAILDKNADFGTFGVPRHQRDPSTLGSPPDASTAWQRWSAKTLESFESRRTAYPLDLTIGELFERDVNVRTAVHDYASDRGDGGRPLSAVIDAGSQRLSSTLLLGEPGAGKSVAACEIARALAAARVFPVILRASEFKALLSPGHEYAEAMSQALRDAASWGFGVSLVIDGLDEMTGSDNAITLAGDFIARAAKAMNVVVTCRRREFEEEISRWVSVGSFTRILSVREWSLPGEFSEYVRKLVAARLLSSTDILGVVRGSPALRDLAARPLFARMLTYVDAGHGAEVSSVTHLYGIYLDRLASSCETSLREAGLEVPVAPLRIWELAGQVIFENRLITDEELNYSAAERILVHETGASSQAIRRAMAYLLDVREKGAVKYAQFVHYSFFEYLVSAAIYERLAAAEDGDPVGGLARRFRHDLPRRMRHFLTELLRRADTIPVGELLADVYRHSRQADLRPAVRRTVCNLIAYVISRSRPDDSRLLTDLLEAEDDPFLRDSLLWAVSHSGDTSGALQFIRELDGSLARREMNRGYLLYYHGDFSRDADPPFMDSLPHRSWSFTRGEVLEMMSGERYASTVKPARQAIDLYTFFDFCISRNETVHGHDAVRLRTLVDGLWTSGTLPPEIGSRLLAQAAICTDVG